MKKPSLEDRFIKLLVDSGVLLTGNFRLKSGAYSPYFIDFGMVPDGAALAELGSCYAAKIMRDIGSDSFDILFGPAFKGIPIALSTATSLSAEFGVRKGFAFNRKAPKEYGEKSLFLGARLSGRPRVLIVDDVITDGGTKYETIELLRTNTDVSLVGALVGVDRSEGKAVVDTFTRRTNLPIWSIVAIQDVRDFIERTQES